MSLNEENSRVILLGLALTIYVFIGAFIVQALEFPLEQSVAQDYWSFHSEFEDKLLNGTATLDDLELLLFMYKNVTSALGIAPAAHERWSFLGSLHFVVTIVTTIGYGSYTPSTDAGKIFVILYGFVGCAGGILFFNLFLERMITFLAYFLRELYIRKLAKDEEDSQEHKDQLLAEWKPSIYWVMLCLFLGVVTIGCFIVPTYARLEGWTYVEASYFCFVSFSTIGFGDFIAAQGDQHSTLYVLVNTVMLAMGCCFLYSIFNVISIVLKQLLNFIIFKLRHFRIGPRRLPWMRLFWWRVRRKRPPPHQQHHYDARYSYRNQRIRREPCQGARKSSIQLIRRTLRKKLGFGKDKEGASSSRSEDDHHSHELPPGMRKFSEDGLICMRDFLPSNQVSLAVMQKQLQDSANQMRGGDIYSSSFTLNNSQDADQQQSSQHASQETPSTTTITICPPPPPMTLNRAPSIAVTPAPPTHYHHHGPSLPNRPSRSQSHAHSHRYHYRRPSIAAGKFIPGTIGPLAILCDKLG